MISSRDKNLAAYRILMMYHDPKFGTSGRRNDDAVNLCIASRCLRKDPEVFILDLVPDVIDRILFRSHVNRIIHGDYPAKWEAISDDSGLSIWHKAINQPYIYKYMGMTDYGYSIAYEDILNDKIKS